MFKDTLYVLRKSNGLTQNDLAKLLGVSASTITMYEKGKRYPEREIEEKVCELFKIDLSELRGVVVNKDTMAEKIAVKASMLDEKTQKHLLSYIDLLLKEKLFDD